MRWQQGAPGLRLPPLALLHRSQMGTAGIVEDGCCLLSIGGDGACPSLGRGPQASSAPLWPQVPLGLPCPQNAARERSRVRALRRAFLSLQAALPTVPAGTKLSKLDILVLATSYIAHLSHALGRGPPPPVPSCPLHGHPLLHPMKKWPMRSRLYAGPWGEPGPGPPGAATATSSHEHSGLGDSRLAMGDGPP
ncbi:transcription factor 23 [Calonectris borealis]|uniref:transcription factor 23 n=1 Tax=Calonectris borealis TaxID=1323832 RepID=UPI003F4B2610